MRSLLRAIICSYPDDLQDLRKFTPYIYGRTDSQDTFNNRELHRKVQQYQPVKIK